MAALHQLLLTGMGSVNLIWGPMFSGKSSELIRRIRLAVAAGLPCCLLRPLLDDRWEEDEELDGQALRTHSGSGLKKSELVTVLRCSTIKEALAEIPKTCKVVAIDEGQFFEDLCAGCRELAGAGKLVHVAALNGAHDQMPWANVAELSAQVESVQMLSAWCMECKLRPAPFTMRVRGSTKGKPASHKIDPGGKEKFQVVCRACLAR